MLILLRDLTRLVIINHLKEGGLNCVFRLAAIVRMEISSRHTCVRNLIGYPELYMALILTGHVELTRVNRIIHNHTRIMSQVV